MNSQSIGFHRSLPLLPPLPLSSRLLVENKTQYCEMERESSSHAVACPFFQHLFRVCGRYPVFFREIFSSKLNYFLTKNALDFLWSYLLPPQLDVVSVSIQLFSILRWAHLYQSITRCFLFPQTLFVHSFLSVCSLFVLPRIIILQMPYWLHQDINVSTCSLPFLYSYPLLWILYEV